ncbi:MAG: hypothetical protein FWD86_00355, partial [Firmicutes bacterium]|nr:hypothetical protein [Bacillota bacterium]
MTNYNIVAATNESTVVTEYVPDKRRATDYQSEAELEKEFIQRLIEQGYEQLTVKNEAGLIDNLRIQLERLNDYA